MVGHACSSLLADLCSIRQLHKAAGQQSVYKVWEQRPTIVIEVTASSLLPSYLGSMYPSLATTSGHALQVAFHSTGLRQVVVNKSNVMLLRAKPQEYRLMVGVLCRLE